MNTGDRESRMRCVLCVESGKKYGFVVEVEQHIIMN